HSEAQGVELPPLELVADHAAEQAIREATPLTDQEFQRISPEVIAALQKSRDFTPQNIRATVAHVGHRQLGYDPVGAAALRHALTQMSPEAAHYARNLLNQRHPQAFEGNATSDPSQAVTAHPETFQQPEHPLGSPDNPASASSDAVQVGELFD